MSTDFDFRALCAELLPPLAEYDGANPYHEHRDLIARARRARGRWIEGGFPRIEGGWQRIEGGSTPSMLRDEVNSPWLDPSVGQPWEDQSND
jgi:hypothetical protein